MILPLFFGTRFAPHSPQSLAGSFRGAKTSQRFRATVCHRQPFQRRDLLPAPRKALRHRFGEQNLHRDSAPPSTTGGLFSGAICSPLPAKPCCFVPGSKIFTEIPRRHLPPAAFSAARFAPRSPQSLETPFRGAKSSQKFRAAICLRRPFQRRDLLPAPPQSLAASFRGAKSSQKFRAAICHRRLLLAPPRRQSHISPSGHANRAPQNPPAGRSCWRRPAGKAIYHRRATPTGRPKFRPAADHVGATLPARPYITVGSRQQGALNPARRPTLLAPPRRQGLISPSGHANRAPRL